MENQKVHFRHIMLFYFKKGKNASQTARKICAVYGESAVSDDTVRRWFYKFRRGNISVEDDVRSGRPSSVNKDILKDAIAENPRYTVQELSHRLNIPKSTVHDNLKKIGARFPKLHEIERLEQSSEKNMALFAAKKALRQHLKEKLKSIPVEEKLRQSEIVVNKLLQNKKYLNSQRISVYLSRDIEIDTQAILSNIFSSGKECFIPKYDSKSTCMDMVKLNSMKEYEELPLTSWKIKQPDSESELENALVTGGLDLIIVPGIGFTKEGQRIGNGKGYYDIYLERLKEVHGNNFSTIALAYQEQIVPSIPVSERDVLIDEVIYAE